MCIKRRQLVKLGCALAGIRLTTVLQYGVSAGDQQGDEERTAFKPLPAADQKSFEAWWIDLEKEEPAASQALLKLAARPIDAVAFLKGKLKPLILNSDRLDELLAKLGKPDENDWKPAFEELEYFDPRLAVDLLALMVDVTKSPARERMVAVMSDRAAASVEGRVVELRPVGRGFNFSANPGGSWWAEPDLSLINTRISPKKKWTRAVRAIALLEHIGTPDAVAVLKEMATGHELAQPTRVATEALRRLSSKAP